MLCNICNEKPARHPSDADGETCKECTTVIGCNDCGKDFDRYEYQEHPYDPDEIIIIDLLVNNEIRPICPCCQDRRDGYLL